jgi:hypothetical protein
MRYSSAAGALADGGDSAEVAPARRPKPQFIAPGRQLMHRRRLPIIPAADPDRPRTRGDCVGGERPCPWVSCRHHLALDVTSAGSLRIAYPDVELEDMAATCSLDVADQGGMALEDIGEVVNLNRERVRQIEEKALRRVKFGLSGWKPEGDTERARHAPEWRAAVPPEPSDEPEAADAEPADPWTEMAYRAELRRWQTLDSARIGQAGQDVPPRQLHGAQQEADDAEPQNSGGMCASGDAGGEAQGGVPLVYRR